MSNSKGLVETVKGWFGEPPTLDAIRAEREAAQEKADREELARRQVAHEAARVAAAARERASSELAALRERVGWDVVSGELEEHVGPLAVAYRELGELVAALDVATVRMVADNERARALAAELGQPDVAVVTLGMARAMVLDALSREMGNAAPSLVLLTAWLNTISDGEERARRVMALFDAGTAELRPEKHAERLLETGDPRIVTREEQLKKREQSRALQAHRDRQEADHLAAFERQQRGGVVGGLQ